MTNFQINSFGSLTTQNGQKLTMEDLKKFDENKDGQINKDEFNKFLKVNKLDEIAIAVVDKDANKIISNEEFSAWENKIAMQEEVNKLASQISKDFGGYIDSAKFITQLQNSFKNYIEEFCTNHSGKYIVKEFSTTLSKKYQDFKAEILADTPKTVKESILEEISSNLISQLSNTNNSLYADIDQSVLQAKTIYELSNTLSRVAEVFISTYSGDNLEVDLRTYLDNYLNKTDAEKMVTANAEFEKEISGSNMQDFKKIKESAFKLLSSALSNGVVINVDGIKVASEAGIKVIITRYSSPDDLINAVRNGIKDLSTTNLIDKTRDKVATQMRIENNNKFSKFTGNMLTVNAATFDYSNISIGGVTYHSEKDYSIKKHGKEGAKEEAWNTINSEQVKGQMKAQLVEKLKAEGLSFDIIEKVFENLFNESAQEAIDENIQGKHSTMFRSSKSSINVKNLIDTLISKFNEKISSAIDEMNASTTDMDLYDLDYETGLSGKDEGGVKVTDDENSDFVKLYKTGATVTHKKGGPDYYVSIAESLIDNMKFQMLAKARNMCASNGLPFTKDIQAKFEIFFNNAKSKAINAAVSGKDSNGNDWKNATIDSIGGVLTGAVGGVTASLIRGDSFEKGAINTAKWAAAGASWGFGPIVGGIATAGVFLSTFFGNNNHSESSLNTKTLIDTFTQTLKESLTSYVNEEKNKKATKTA